MDSDEKAVTIGRVIIYYFAMDIMISYISEAQDSSLFIDLA
jgi:hypothetical protein